VVSVSTGEAVDVAAWAVPVSEPDAQAARVSQREESGAEHRGHAVQREGRHG